jgi:hypothetical protein
MMSICLFFSVTFFGGNKSTNFFNPIFNTKVVLRASPLFCSFHCFARDYIQTGYSDRLDISYLFNNITKSFWILIIDAVDVQITKWLLLSFIIFKSAGEGEGWFESDSTWLIHSKKKHQKTQTATQLYC